jgi:hypothetical protein
MKGGTTHSSLYVVVRTQPCWSEAGTRQRGKVWCRDPRELLSVLMRDLPTGFRWGNRSRPYVGSMAGRRGLNMGFLFNF